MTKTATFIGHKDSFGINRPKIKALITELIEKYGFTEFLCGGMGDFDELCARAVWELKGTFPHVKNLLVIPYLSFSIQNPSYYDEIIYPAELEGKFFKRSILLRNQYLINHAQAAVCHIDHPWGGAYTTYLYAKKRGLQLFEI